eukprot:m.8885 g.8885  ORF g.8885 m.8885 type:complete len:844 (-) comp7259_c0_seq1:201-2732(-)
MSVLQKKLKQFRYEAATARGKKAFHVFSNKELELLAFVQPTTKAALLNVRGFGPQKVQEYGQGIIDVCRLYGNGTTPNTAYGIPSANGRMPSTSKSNGAAKVKRPQYEPVIFAGVSSELCQDLNAFRLATANARPTGAVPAFCVFSNKVRDDLVVHKPTTLAALLSVPGFGPQKVAEYGAGIVAICQRYQSGHATSDRKHAGADLVASQPKRGRTLPSTITNTVGATHRTTSAPVRSVLVNSSTTTLGRTSSADNEFLTQQRREMTHRAQTEGEKHISHSSLTAEQRRIADRVLSNGESVFLTGPAGTGKSFLFRYLKQQLVHANEKHGVEAVAVTAPTGVAAINVGGQTIHSWAGVGLGKGSLDTLIKKVEGTAAAAQRWKSAKVLLIDEISMLDGALFDTLAKIGASVRNKAKPFGGLQLVLCGDFFQLPPVGLDQPGKTFAFKADAWTDVGLVTHHLSEVLRQQSDPGFISVLNDIRVGVLSETSIEALDRCHVTRKPRPTDGIVPTKLYCLNKEVDSENAKRLAMIQADEVVYDATSTDKFKGQAETSNDARRQVLSSIENKAPCRLALKVGAQVVLVRNLDQENKLVNGSRGIVVGFDDIGPNVRFDCGVTRCIQQQEFWVFRGSLGSVSRVQIPLKLAWALTVHKSQGMTLSRVEVELGSAFDYGQVYVALSRAEKRDGLWLSGQRLRQGVVKAHPDVQRFYKANTKAPQHNQDLNPSLSFTSSTMPRLHTPTAAQWSPTPVIQRPSAGVMHGIKHEQQEFTHYIKHEQQQFSPQLESNGQRFQQPKYEFNAADNWPGYSTQRQSVDVTPYTQPHHHTLESFPPPPPAPFGDDDNYL